jgi:hypothetical protein
MRCVPIALGGVLALALCSQALADRFIHQPNTPGRSPQACGFERAPPAPRGSMAQGGEGRRIENRLTIGSATGGAGSGKVHTCAAGRR